MRPPRRLTAALMLLLLLQVLGLGSGVLQAAEPAADCTSRMAGTSGDMEGMPGMPGMPIPDAPPSSTEHGPRTPCGLPWAFGCTSAAACLPVLAPAAPVRPAPRAAAQARVAAVDAALPDSPARVPELPPPRD